MCSANSSWSHLGGTIGETDISLARVLCDCSLHCSVLVGTPSNGILFTFLSFWCMEISMFFALLRDYCEAVVSFTLTSRIGIGPAGLTFPAKSISIFWHWTFPVKEIQSRTSLGQLIPSTQSLLFKDTDDVLSSCSPQNEALLSISIHCVSTWFPNGVHISGENL